MTGASQPLLLVAGLLMAFSAIAEPTEPPPLAHNPFARPPSDALALRPVANRPGSALARPIDLRATMVGTHHTLASVEGKILRPGVEIHGCTLVQVFEDHAVFSRAGKRDRVARQERQGQKGQG